MFLLKLQYWPIAFICVAMLASAIIDWWKFKVPNVLTLPVIALGWLFGLLHTFGGNIVPGDGVGGIGASLAGTAMGSLLLLAYIIGGMGAGDVKMCMGFGAWVGAFYGIEGSDRGGADGQAIGIIFYAQLAGILVGGVIGMVMILLRMEFRKNVEHARSIVMDFATTGSIGKMAERANERRPRWHRLPYGVPMCIGFVGYLLLVQPMLSTAEGDQTRLATGSSLARVFFPNVPNSALFAEDLIETAKPVRPALSLQAAKELKLFGSIGRN